ncbi:MAG TPA: hypothetical protein VEU96_18325 [Bryobacteraceae bacterium]|nr:hypothetical protein [Bryobacteraceae bacterium]
MVGLASLAGALMICWLFTAHYTPDLLPTEAAFRILDAPEFNRTRTLVKVSKTTRCSGSMSESCYDAEFSFVEQGSRVPIQAKAYFTLGLDEWRLESFSYGTERVLISEPVPQVKE